MAYNAWVSAKTWRSMAQKSGIVQEIGVMHRIIAVQRSGTTQELGV